MPKCTGLRRNSLTVKPDWFKAATNLSLAKELSNPLTFSNKIYLSDCDLGIMFSIMCSSGFVLSSLISLTRPFLKIKLKHEK